MATLKNKFIEGMLAQHSIRECDFPRYKYAGGDHYPRERELQSKDRHARTFALLFPGREYDDAVERCPCGKDIQYNCYIKHEDAEYNNSTELIAVGSCCIEKFMGESCTRKCVQCGLHNSRRKSAKCRACTDVYCCRTNCRTKRYKSNELCYTCKYPGNGVCKDCGKAVKGNYQRCYTCNKKFFENYNKSR